jgi:hypothetical protein
MSPSSRPGTFHRDLVHGHSRPPQVPATRSCLDAYVRGLWSKGTVLPLRDLVAKSPSRIGGETEGLECTGTGKELPEPSLTGGDLAPTTLSRPSYPKHNLR